MGCALEGNNDDWVQEMVSRLQSFPWIFLVLYCLSLCFKASRARQGVRLVNFAHELQSLDPEDPERQHPEAKVEN